MASKMADNTELMLTKLLSFQRSNPHVNYYGSQIFTGSEVSTSILDQDITQKTTETEDVSEEQQVQLLSQTSNDTIYNFEHNDESEHYMQRQDHFSSNLIDEVRNYPCLCNLKPKPPKPPICWYDDPDTNFIIVSYLLLDFSISYRVIATATMAQCRLHDMFLNTIARENPWRSLWSLWSDCLVCFSR